MTLCVMTWMAQRICCVVPMAAQTSSGTNSRQDFTSDGFVPSTYGKGLLWNFFCSVSVNRTASLALLMS